MSWLCLLATRTWTLGMGLIGLADIGGTPQTLASRGPRSNRYGPPPTLMVMGKPGNISSLFPSRYNDTVAVWFLRSNATIP